MGFEKRSHWGGARHLTGVEVCHFAYPNYDVDIACMESVEQAGYRTAVTNVVRYRRLGDARRRSMALPRFVVGGHAWVGGNLLTMVRYGGGEV